MSMIGDPRWDGAGWCKILLISHYSEQWEIEIYEMLTSGIFHLISLNWCWLGVPETMKSENVEKVVG